jgi:S-adenosylmethionine:tRNA ribosyltransferase-isomerase
VIAAAHAVQRPPDARLLVIDAAGGMRHAARGTLLEFLRPGDLVVANDAATLPASLHGRHAPSGAPIEVRLAARASLSRDDVRFAAVVFGAGDWRTRTEERPLPPRLAPGETLALGPLTATVDALLGHARLVALRFQGSPDAVWAGIARHGRPIQYAYLSEALALWDVWTPLAALPVAFEPPSAGFALDWSLLAAMRLRAVDFATITLAAGISSTGDPALDARLPLDEPYRVPFATAAAMRRAKATGARVIAVGTTVVRALEHSQGRPGDGVADQRIGPGTPLGVVDAILSGTHEPGESHYQLLRAFAEDATLAGVIAELEARGYRTHEFGDSMLVFKTGGARCRIRLRPNDTGHGPKP